jgi:uncharacterized protein
MKLIKIIVVVFVVLLLLILTFSFLKKNTPKSQTELSIANKVKIAIEVANTDEELQQGYSNHQPISDKEGMLFIMPTIALHTFWMKDMLFDLDFIYIQNNKVVDLVKNIPSPANNQGEIAYVNPKVAVNQVLEVKSGFIDQYKIEIGDWISLKSN